MDSCSLLSLFVHYAPSIFLLCLTLVQKNSSCFTMWEVVLQASKHFKIWMTIILSFLWVSLDWEPGNCLDWTTWAYCLTYVLQVSLTALLTQFSARPYSFSSRYANMHANASSISFLFHFVFVCVLAWLCSFQRNNGGHHIASDSLELFDVLNRWCIVHWSCFIDYSLLWCCGSLM